MSAWQSLPDQIAIDDKAAAELADFERATRKPVNPDDLKARVIEETWIQTNPEDFTKRTGVKAKTVHGKEDDAIPAVVKVESNGETSTGDNDEAGGVSLNAGSAPTSALTTAMDVDAEPPAVVKVEEGRQDVTSTTVDTKMLDAESAPKRSAEEISTAPSSPVVAVSEPEVQLPQKVAVIVKFSLGSSQYATMALRELMKAGGVKTYKPDFSSGR